MDRGSIREGTSRRLLSGRRRRMRSRRGTPLRPTRSSPRSLILSLLVVCISYTKADLRILRWLLPTIIHCCLIHFGAFLYFFVDQNLVYSLLGSLVRLTMGDKIGALEDAKRSSLLAPNFAQRSNL